MQTVYLLLAFDVRKPSEPEAIWGVYATLEAAEKSRGKNYPLLKKSDPNFNFVIRSFAVNK